MGNSTSCGSVLTDIRKELRATKCLNGPHVATIMTHPGNPKKCPVVFFGENHDAIPSRNCSSVSSVLQRVLPPCSERQCEVPRKPIRLFVEMIDDPEWIAKYELGLREDLPLQELNVHNIRKIYTRYAGKCPDVTFHAVDYLLNLRFAIDVEPDGEELREITEDLIEIFSRRLGGRVSVTDSYGTISEELEVLVDVLKAYVTLEDPVYVSTAIAYLDDLKKTIADLPHETRAVRRHYEFLFNLLVVACDLIAVKEILDLSEQSDIIMCYWGAGHVVNQMTFLGEAGYRDVEYIALHEDKKEFEQFKAIVEDKKDVTRGRIAK